MKIEKNGSHASKTGPPQYVTGAARFDFPYKAEAPGRVEGVTVTFEPAARLIWHTHPFGEVLIVTAGLGWAQGAGGPVQEIRPGDVVWFAAGEKHWHGAAATTSVTHIAIVETLDGKNTDWLEKVSDEEYHL